MYQYHGWMSTLESSSPKEIETGLREINRDYPVSAAFVNGELHISFSGSPNRDCGELSQIINYLCGLQLKLTGIVYINDPDSERFDQFDCIKVVNDLATRVQDNNFTLEETKSVFE